MGGMGGMGGIGGIGGMGGMGGMGAAYPPCTSAPPQPLTHLCCYFGSAAKRPPGNNITHRNDSFQESICDGRP